MKVNLSKGERLLISLVTGVLPSEQIELVKVRLKEDQLLVGGKAVILGNQGEKCTMAGNGQIEWLPRQISFALNEARGNLETPKELVPPVAGLNQTYYPEESIGWTASFWPGMSFLARKLTNSTEFDGVIAIQMASFQYHLDKQTELEIYDIGFLYTLTAIADYRVNDHEASKEMILQAAGLLMERYSPKAEIIQARENLNDLEQRGRMIIDCLMNLPSLYFAVKVTGKQGYYETTYNHAKQTWEYIV